MNRGRCRPIAKAEVVKVIENLKLVVDRINELGNRFGFSTAATYQEPLEPSVKEISFQETLTKEIEKSQQPVAQGDGLVKKVSAPPELSSDFSDFISRYAQRTGLAEGLVEAVIKAESNFDPNSVSPKGALGLMQLMPKTATEMGVNNPFDPEENIMGGTKYLSSLLDQFGGDLKLALAAYNAGPTTVERYQGLPPYPETKEYVSRVLSLYSSQK